MFPLSRHKFPTRLALISFIVLFLELLLIRLVATEVRIFAYLSNLLLMAIFVGSGLGMLVKKKLPLTISPLLLIAVTAGIIFGVFKNITEYLSPLNQSFIWFQTPLSSWYQIMIGIILTIILFLLVMAIFIPLGQHLGDYFENSKQIMLYYSINILFSLIGIWAFNLLSFLNLSPYLGIFLVQLVIIFLAENGAPRLKPWGHKKPSFTNVSEGYPPHYMEATSAEADSRIHLHRLTGWFSAKADKNLTFSAGVVVASFILVGIANPAGQNIYWSPYQKLALIKLPSDYFQAPGYQLQVNNVGYMGLLDLSKNFQNGLAKKLETETIPENFDIRFSNQYDLPYKIKSNPKNVLIIGAGGGNDAAGAIRAGITQIDAVEIDPLIISLGRKYHPENPYSNSSVNITIGDGRTFLKKTQKKYDLVIMSLADSHTLNSSLNNIQLDNFLYTKESIAEIKSILTSDGMLFISFEVRRSWIGEKIQANLSRVFGHNPLVFNLQEEIPLLGWGGTVFVQDVSRGQIEDSLSSDPDLKQFIDKRKLSYGSPIKELTDDWPYLYLDKPRFPLIHLIISIGILTFIVLAKNGISQGGKFHWDSFFLGSGFLLFEFQNISKTSLLYGNTWITNVYTISAVLFFILAANLISAVIKTPLKIIYLFLFFSFIVEIILPVSFFNQFFGLGKYLISPFVLNLPLLFSGLIFINLFQAVKDKQGFFASNLIGSAFGGILGFTSYLFGLKFLLYIGLLVYFLSFLTLSSRHNQTPAAPYSLN